ncbi:MAG: thiamine diphosphokinase [Pseudomonadota bacterium]
MAGKCVNFEEPVTLVGGGVLDREGIDAALALAPNLVAADGAADRLWRMSYRPNLIIGDMDSIEDPAVWPERGADMIVLREQDTTDFEKCLYSTKAPCYVGVGFTGARVDHMLAVFHAMLAHAEKQIVLVGEEEVIALLPPGHRVAVEVGAGATVSFYPLVPVTVRHTRGLRWQAGGLTMAVGEQVGTSNIAEDDEIEVTVETSGLLMMLPRKALDNLVRAIQPQTAPDGLIA